MSNRVGQFGRILLLATGLGPWPAAAEPPLDLPALIRLALENNLELRAVAADPQARAGELTAAKGRFDPSLTLALNGTGTRIQSVLPDASRSASSLDTRQFSLALGGQTAWSTQYSLCYQRLRAHQEPLDALASQYSPTEWNSGLTFSLTQPLLRGRGPALAAAPVAQARLALEAARGRLQEQAVAVVAAVEQAHAAFELAVAGERAQQAGLDRARALAEQSRTLADLHLLARADLTTAEKAVAQRQASLGGATLARADAAEALLALVFGAGTSQALGGAVDRLVADPDREPPLPELQPVALCETRALAQRGLLQAGRDDLAALRLGRRLAEDALRPSLDLTGSYALQGQRDEAALLRAGIRPYDQGLQGWTLGLTLGLPLGNRAARGGAARAQAQERAQELALAGAELQVRSAVRAAHRGVLAARAQLADAGRALELSRAALAADNERHRLGLVDGFRLLQVDAEVIAAEQVLAQARFQAKVALSRYRAALGETPGAAD